MYFTDLEYIDGYFKTIYKFGYSIHYIKKVEDGWLGSRNSTQRKVWTKLDRMYYKELDELYDKYKIQLREDKLKRILK